MNRTTMRENAFKFLYEIEVQNDITEEHINLFLTINDLSGEDVKLYILDMVNGIEENREKIVEIISKHLTENWEYERLSKINKALLKLAIYEILYKKIDFKIVIDEIMELAKKYADETDPVFINGVLASVVKNSLEV